MSARGLPAIPYPGLRPFKKDEWAIYFGREPMIDAVLDRLAEQQLVVVHGSSGCGKSSLIRAGVLPRLEQEHILHGVPWRTAEMRPGGSPLWHMAETIARLIYGLSDDKPLPVGDVRRIHRILNLGKTGLQQIQEQFGLGIGGNACLLLDQFEELFRYARAIGREEAETLIDVLKAFHDKPPKGIHAIVTMRSDHLGDCAQFTGFAELVNETQYLLPRMDKMALMRAIREPARLFGGEVSADLALRMIDESQNEPDALPLIQHCLMRLWQEFQPKTKLDGLTDRPQAPFDQGSSKPTPNPFITTEGYIGLQSTLSQHADEVLDQLVQEYPDAEKVTEYLFRAITEIDPEGRGIRSPMPLSQLVAITGEKPVILDRVIDGFAQNDCGFVTRSNDDEPLIDISHEALIRCWSRLDNPAIDKTTKRPEGWLQREEEDGRLWHSLLVQAESGEEISAGVLHERQAWLNSLPGKAWTERHGAGWYLVQALMARSQRAHLEAKQREDAAKRRERLLMIGLASGAIVSLLLAVLAGLSWFSSERAAEAESAAAARAERLAIAEAEAALRAEAAAIRAVAEANRARQAERQAQIGDSVLRADQAQQQLQNGFPVTAMQLALAGLPINPGPDDRPWVAKTANVLADALRAQRERWVLKGHEGPVWSLALSADGQRLFSSSYDNTIRLWDARTSKQLKVLEGHEAPVWSLAQSIDGKRIVSGSEDKTIRIWDTRTGEQLKVLRGHGWAVTSLALSTDGQRIISGSEDKTIRIWDTQTGEQLKVLKGHGWGVTSLALSTDGQRIISGSEDKTIRIWDTQTGEQLKVLEGHEAPVWSLAISANRGRVVSGSYDSTIRVWDIRTGEQLKVLKGHEGPVWSLAISPDGDRIISGSEDRTIRLWDARTGEQRQILKGHEGAIWSLAISLDGNRIFSGSYDNTIRLWTAQTTEQVEVLTGHAEGVTSLAVSSDGRHIVSGSYDKTIRIWDIQTGEQRQILRGHEGPVWSLAISPDGQHIVSGSYDKTIRIWDIHTGEQRQILRGHEGPVWSLAISPEGRRIVSGSDDSTIRIWDIQTGEQLEVLRGHKGSVYALAISANGQRIISGSEDSTIRLWHARTNQQLKVLTGHEEGVTSLAVSNDGKHIVSGSYDNTIRLWDTRTDEQLQVIKDHGGGFTSLSISADGRHIVNGSDDSMVRLWDTNTSEQLQVLKGHAGPIWSLAISPDGQHVISGSSDKTIRITWVGRSKDDLIKRARERLPREMTGEEKRRFYIAVD